MEETKKYAQMEKQNKPAGNKLDEMEISNLSDAEFKTLVFRMLQELIGYFNSIKMIQAEMKVALSEIKKSLQELIVGRMKLRTEMI